MSIDRLVPLTADKIKSYLRELIKDQLSSDVMKQTLDLRKEFRSKDYPLLHLLLKNPLQELLSMTTPKATEDGFPASPEESVGYLFLYDSGFPITSRRNDSVQWNQCKKMSVKLIVYNDDNDLYKLKNNKNDKGTVVMRRQTWRGDGDHHGWRRNEYKLVTRETYFKQDASGRLSVTECKTVQDFPVLVHYFYKRDKTFVKPPTIRRRRKKLKTAHVRPGTEEREMQPTSEAIILQQLSSQQSMNDSEDSNLSNDNVEFQEDKKMDISLRSSLSVDMQSPIESNSSPHSLIDLSPSFLDSPQLLTSIDPKNLLSSPLDSHSQRSSISSPPMSPHYVMSPSRKRPRSLSLSNPQNHIQQNQQSLPQQHQQPSPQQQQQIISSPISSPMYSPHMQTYKPSPSLMLPINIKTEQMNDQEEDENVIPSEMDILSASVVSFTHYNQPPPMVSTTASSSAIVMDGMHKGPLANIKTYAPDSGHASEYTKVILVTEGWELIDPNSANISYSFSCLFEEKELPVLQVSSHVLEFYAPPHKPGIVYFWIVCREILKNEVYEKNDDDDNNNNEKTLLSDDVGPVDPMANNQSSCNTVQYSHPVPFYYTPVDGAGQLSLAWELFGQSNINDIMTKFKYTAREIDLSHNNLTNVNFLEGFNSLHSLILDNNHISQDAKFPTLLKLQTLSINHNWITEIDKFLDNLVQTMPQLRYLSTLHNAACPFFSSAKHHYYNYRVYLISRLRNLTHLDCSPVTLEEWRHASCIIPENEKDQLQVPLQVQGEDADGMDVQFAF